MRSQALLSKEAERDRQGGDSWRPQLPAVKAPGGGGEGGGGKKERGRREEIVPTSVRQEHAMKKLREGREGRKGRKEGGEKRQTNEGERWEEKNDT